MNSLKLLSAAVMFSYLLTVGSPASISAGAINQMPPAMVFIQDQKDMMKVYHNFQEDNGLLIPWDEEADEGIWASIP